MVSIFKSTRTGRLEQVSEKESALTRRFAGLEVSTKALAHSLGIALKGRRLWSDTGMVSTEPADRLRYRDTPQAKICRRDYPSSTI